MNNEELFAIIGEVDEQKVAAAGMALTAKPKVRPVWHKWGVMVACLAVVVVLVPFLHITPDKLPTEYIQRIEYNDAYYEVCAKKSILKRLGIKKNITETDAGVFITYLVEKHPGGKSEYIATEEETNIVLYSYAVAPCKAIYVIRDKGIYNAVVFCNYVLPDTETVSMEMLYALYDIENAWDISSISVVNDWFEKKVIGPVITDETVIADFFSASLPLEDYSNDEYHKMNYGHIDTEETLLQAYDKTAENKLTILLETPDGLRFCLEYDAEGGWLYSNKTLRYYRVSEEMKDWFSQYFSF